MRVESSTDTFAMISAACAELGERALDCAAGTDFTHIPQSAHVKVVGTVNFAATFPACRAVVHHDGAGTTAASLCAGVPTLILLTDLDQALWGVRVNRLKVGAARRFSTTTQESLVEDLRWIVAPEYASRSREFATRMAKPAASVAAAADLMENPVLRRAG
jgi:UDP:flavonoid glycosyltransferase YjiC (YdhE family)